MLRKTFRDPNYTLPFLYCVLTLLLSACSPTATPTPFIAPFGPRVTPTAGVSVSLSTPTPGLVLTPVASNTVTILIATATALPQKSPTPEATLAESLPTITTEPANPTPRTCSDSFRYLADITYPDGTNVTPGQTIDKQWLVENNGTCDWDKNYSLKLVEGYPGMGAAAELALLPTRANNQVTISMNFTAPLEAGNYQTAWQAYNPEGIAFGEIIFMVIVVSP